MEIIAIGLPLIGIGAYLKWKPTRALAWYTLAAWAEANGDAAVLRTKRLNQYVSAAAERAGV